MTALEYLKHVLKSGIRPDQSFSEKKEIIFTNKFALSLSLIGLAITIVDLSFGDSAQALLAFAIFILVNLTFPLQRKGHHFLAQVLLWAVPTISALSAVVLYGTRGNVHFYFIALLCVSLIFFKNRITKTLMFIFHVGLFVGFEYWRNEYTPFLMAEPSTIFDLSNIVIMMFSLWLLLFEFQNHGHQYDLKINRLMKSIQEHSNLLEEKNKQIESQAIQLRASNQILKKEAVEKEKAQHQLLESNKELKQFAHIASHDLKEPLRTVASFTQLIQKKHQHQFDEASNEYFHFVVDAVSRMSRLLDDLLEFSRLNRNKEKKETNLNEVVQLVEYNLKHQLEKEDGSIDTEPLPSLMLDKQQFTQLFQNLISNALKFRRKEVPPKIDIGYREKEQEYQFFVKDNGIGIPCEYKEKVFALFQRLHNRTEYEGSGIGLSICRKVVQNHSGEIWLEPTEGPGTTIGFSVPKILNES